MTQFVVDWAPVVAAVVLGSLQSESKSTSSQSSSPLPIPTTIYVNMAVTAKKKAPPKSVRKSPPRKAKSTGKKKGGRLSGTRNLSKDDLLFLLDALEEILPIGPDKWNEVVEQHNMRFPTPGRDMYAIRRKYMTLQRKTIPTGDPKYPAEVKQAKRIKYKLGQKADLGDAAESYSIENGFDEPESPMLLGQKTQEEDEEEENNSNNDNYFICNYGGFCG